MRLFLSKHKRELLRVGVVTGAGLAILLPDSSSQVVLYAVGISLILTALSHILRKVLFPYLDLEIIAKKASEVPLGASIVFASVCFLLSTLISVFISLLR